MCCFGNRKSLINLKLPLGVDRVIKLGGHLITFSAGIPITQGKRPTLAMNFSVEILGIPMAFMEIVFIVIVEGQPVGGIKIKSGVVRIEPSMAGCSQAGLLGCRADCCPLETIIDID